MSLTQVYIGNFKRRFGWVQTLGSTSLADVHCFIPFYRNPFHRSWFNCFSCWNSRIFGIDDSRAFGASHKSILATESSLATK